MNFTVDWSPAALQELADLWNTAADRNEVADASNDIDRVLAVDPRNAGESRGGVTRIYFRPPFAVMLDVFEARRHVLVWAIWRPFG